MSLSSTELALLLRPTPFIPRPESLWRPPLDWPFVVAHMRPELREVYTSRCEEWHRTHAPRTPPSPPSPKPENKINPNLFAIAARRYGALIPIPELFKIGYSKEEVANVVARRKWFKDHDASLQKEIERRWPGGKIKPKKVIKAVNKRMPGGVENV